MARSIAFVGGGNMARALIAGLASSDQWQIHVVDQEEPLLESLRAEFKCSVCNVIDEQIGENDIIVLAVKPNVVPDVCLKLEPLLKNQLIVSVAAGVSTSSTSGWLGGYSRIVRAMPNTPALARAGMTGLFATPQVEIAWRAVMDELFCSVGEILWCTAESDIDAVTAISGSGPAYVFYFVEAMIEAARQFGFSQSDAMSLATQTFCGAMKLLAVSEESPEILRQRVTSKGGTTAAAISALESHGVKDAIVKAAQAARHRAIELSEGK
ncbi:Pyrroline-5-carboxylate reductase [Paraburkholderia piptadeniae]|uniref:Pyrroline-5-carboxylate reductase n=2 Tax=Paraburkholderia TaxID=1822464 RepID=A0A7X1TIG6_9BURK|nr:MULTISPECIES: pyrroline-5-carboxylate reductase [Paraburkholderia]MPW20473.1 pyrroline-5-carboxylate reductase [Paraburkholderia franconis]SIT50875.1 Pyrroline-5-carboxylate reductase [Paraburkholderia piptadeniae]